MKSGIIAIAGAFGGLVLLLPNAASAKCCNYGCCDCGCIALTAQKNASSIAKSIEQNLKSQGKGASVQSFKIDIADKASAQSKWTCTPAESGAVCTRQ
jgi:hypothetical protein